MNRVKLLTILVLLGLIPQYAFSDKILLNYKENSFQKKKQHPAEQYLSSVKKESQKKTSSRFADKSYNKLLIILVGFQEEITDDPNTTGNGQFQMDVPDDYPIQLSKPPHDQEFFDKMALAMKYYYGAASLGGFELDWDIYPQDKECYTLSEPMGYYNPPDATNEEFVSKMEEYFKESFETADRESPEIVFSDYAHFMIIHAGSDWQHDVNADTPSDIPSFFIRVGDGKEAIVDEHTWVKIHDYMQQWGPNGLNLGSPTYTNARKLFNSNNNDIAMCLSGLYQEARIKYDNPDFYNSGEWMVVPFPTFENAVKDVSASFYGQFYMVNADASKKTQDKAWELIGSMLSNEKAYLTEVNLIPPTKTLMSSEEFVNMPYADVFIGDMERAHHLYFGKNSTEIQSLLSTAVSNVMLQDVSPEQAYQNLKASVQELIDEE